MTIEYRSYGRRFVVFHHTGETHLAAHCDEAPRACVLLNKARDLNDRQRKYTAAARKIAEAETLAGFEWVTP